MHLHRRRMQACSFWTKPSLRCTNCPDKSHSWHSLHFLVPLWLGLRFMQLGFVVCLLHNPVCQTGLRDLGSGLMGSSLMKRGCRGSVPRECGGHYPMLDGALLVGLFCSGILALQPLFCLQPGHAGSGVTAEKIREM